MAQLEDVAKENNCNLSSHADDDQLHVHCLHNNVAAAARQLERGASTISDRMASRRFKLNPTKNRTLVVLDATDSLKVQQGCHRYRLSDHQPGLIVPQSWCGRRRAEASKAGIVTL